MPARLLPVLGWRHAHVAFKEAGKVLGMTETQLIRHLSYAQGGVGHFLLSNAG